MRRVIFWRNSPKEWQSSDVPLHWWASAEDARYSHCWLIRAQCHLSACSSVCLDRSAKHKENTRKSQGSRTPPFTEGYIVSDEVITNIWIYRTNAAHLHLIIFLNSKKFAPNVFWGRSAIARKRLPDLRKCYRFSSWYDIMASSHTAWTGTVLGVWQNWPT